MTGRMGENRSLTVGGTDLSDFVESVEMLQDYATAEVTATNSVTRTYAMSTKPDSVLAVSFFWSNLATEVFQVLNGFKGTVQAVEAVYDSTASAGDIVTITGQFNISQVPLIPGAKHDEIDMASVTWQPAGAVTVTIT